jgi:hypothetical protein
MSDLIPVSRRCERLARIALIVAMTLSLLFIVLAIAAVGIIYVGTRPTHGAVTEEFDFAAAIVINPFALTLFLPAVLIAAARILDFPVLRQPLGQFSLSTALLLYVLIVALFVACRVLQVDIGYGS